MLSWYTPKAYEYGATVVLGAYFTDDDVQVFDMTGLIEPPLSVLPGATPVTPDKVSFGYLIGSPDTNLDPTFVCHFGDDTNTIQKVALPPTTPAYPTTSTTAQTISGDYSLLWDTAYTGAFAEGQRVRVVDATTPTNYMEGVISGLVTNTSITVSVDTISGSGTISNWNFLQSNGFYYTAAIATTAVELADACGTWSYSWAGAPVEDGADPTKTQARRSRQIYVTSPRFVIP